MAVGSAAAFLLVRYYGNGLAAPTRAASVAAAVVTTSPPPDVLLRVLLALLSVVVLGRLFGVLLRALGQPPVIGELVAGIVLGPSLLGRIAPVASAYLLPPAAAPYLSLVAQFGVVLYMFLVGLELNGDLLRDKAHATFVTSHASIVAPFILGATLALYLYPRLSTSDVLFVDFSLFIGVAMSITAFPVLARILTDRGMSRTPLGAVALACAAAGDVTAWCLLALVVGIAKGTLQAALWSIAFTGAFIAAMFLVVRPTIERLVARSDGRAPRVGVLALALVGLALSALATEWTGVHAIFGAFVFGAVIPHDSALARTLTTRLHGFVSLVLLPAFFAFTGMRTQIGLVSGGALWMIAVVIIVVATAGKFGGTLLAARASGMGWRQASMLGILMNTRGLMEIIVLTIGLDLGIISPTLFAMMVLMALATTIMTTPLLALLERGAPTQPTRRLTP